MISKKRFCTTIQKIEQKKVNLKAISNSLSCIFENFNEIKKPIMEKEVVNLLEIAFKDKDHLIGSFINSVNPKSIDANMSIAADIYDKFVAQSILSKDQFIYYINLIRDNDKKMDRVSNEIEKIIDGWVVFDDLYTSIILDLVEEMFEDKDDFIWWWLYEDVEKIIYYNETGTERSLENVEDLYDYLIENFKTKKEN